MKRIFKLVEKYFFIIILIAVVIAVINPRTFNWVMDEFMGVNIINILLGVILFGMGTTLKIDDFIRVFGRPKEILVGVSAQYIVMPLIAFALASMFSLEAGLTVGLILVGTVPGGTASDVITFLAKGEKIDIVISLGPRNNTPQTETVRVPRLMNLSLQEIALEVGLDFNKRRIT